MPITLTNPLTVPASEPKVYNELWLTRLNIFAPDPNADARIIAEVRAARTLSDGTREFGPGEPVVFTIDDFFARTQTDPRGLQVMGSLLGLLKEYAGL